MEIDPLSPFKIKPVQQMNLQEIPQKDDNIIECASKVVLNPGPHG